ncbi:hypothetical protein ACP70R_034235 [Stipagrostis hirtigluma subsp. patula]
MAAYGAGAAAGSDAPHAEVSSMGQTNPLSSGLHSWSSSTGTASVSWNYPVDKPSQDTVYYDPQRDVSVSGGDQNVGSSAAHAAQSTMGTATATHSQVPYSSSVQHGYNPVEYGNYYYSYPQATNDSSVQQGANQHPGAAYQPLTSFQNSGPYIDSTSNTYYNAGGHQTAPGYGSNSYYYQNNTWNGGSSGNNYVQSYQNYSSSDTNALQSSTSVPATANSLQYNQPYNQWPYYYNHSVPSASSNPVAGNSNSDNTAANTPSGYSYPSQPPPPGTTSWKSNSVASVAPPMQVPGVQGPQNQYANKAEDQYNQAPGVPWSQNHYANQAPVAQYPQNTNHGPLSHPEEQQRTTDSKGSSSNILSNNHISETFQPHLQGSVTTDTSSESKIQIPTNPRIAPGFSMAIPKSEKKIVGADVSKKPAYVSVSMPKNDAKATQVDLDARSMPFSLRNYTMRNLSRCKDDAQRAACQSIMLEITRKAIADGTLLTKNWDTEPLFPLPESVAAMTGTSANNSSPFLSTSAPRKRVKSRWEPAVEEKVTNKVEPIAKGVVNSNINSISEPNRTGSSWERGKFLQSRQAPLNKVSPRHAKKQKIGRNSSQVQNGSASSESDKEQDLTKYYASAAALANSPEEKKRREHRSKRFEKNQDSSIKSRNSSANKDTMANMHARRAISSLLSRASEEGTSLAVEDIDWDALTIKGTCQEIEKRYLRLTSAPDPSTVRPEDVLEKALAMVETSQKNYLYKCDQLKSIRQDLTVQRIQNELTVKVYETHARLAMQAGDLPEYNQCQSQLKRLYAEGIKGCYFEFSAYNLLCVMLHSKNKRDLLSSMASLSKEAKQDGAVKHALAVHAAILSGNYVLFFKLYKQAPNLNSCLMDLYVETMRYEAMRCMSKSYRPTVPVGYVAQILGFLRTDSEDHVINGDDGSEECEIWLKAHGAVISVDNSGELQIDMKASSATLYMPEPENAVAHGDASLAVNDFLARTS